MDDSACQEYFAQPTQTYHRRYEALRAVFVEGRSQKKVAKEFGFSYGAMRQLVFEFRHSCADRGESTESPFFEMFIRDAPLSMRTMTIALSIHP
jgi:hypothetical protein